MSARFADDSVAQVRDRTNIVEVISRYVSLKRSGRGHMGLCPFHGEKTPSFSVSGERGFFHCFGCGVSGDVFKFLMQMEGLTFPEALERLAKEAGVELPRRTREPGADDARERQFRALEIAAEYFRRALWAEKSGQMARAYLEEREIREPTTHSFGLGWAPAQGLVHALEAERVSMADGEAAGLVGRSQRDGGWYDRFRSRLMFPIHDLGNRVVGFGGRLLGSVEGQPKYLNSSDSPTFHKGRLLYGLAAAREAIRKSDEAIVVEGYMDVIALAQAGIAAVVAPLGTALTADQVRLLHRFTDRIVVLFDGDDAGRAAAARSFAVFAEAGIFADGAFLPEDEDPDSLVRKAGRSAVEERLAARAPLVDHYLTTLAPRGASLVERQRGAASVAELLTRTSDPIFAGLLARQAAEHFGIAESQLLARVRRPAPAARSAPTASAPEKPKREPLSNEESLLIELLLVEPALRTRDLERELGPWLSATATAIVDRIREAGAGLDPAELFEELSKEARDKVANALLVTEESANAYGNAVQAYEDCLLQLRRRRLKERQAELTRKINEAEQQGDEEAVARWQEEKKNLLRGIDS